MKFLLSSRNVDILVITMKTDRILVYKRTHPWDPDESGVFGCQDCMGQVRGYNFNYVIGFGGWGAETRRFNLQDKIHWVGRAPLVKPVGIGSNKRGPVLFFSAANFRLYEQSGPNIYDFAPAFFESVKGNRFRFRILNRDEKYYDELMAAISACLE